VRNGPTRMAAAAERAVRMGKRIVEELIDDLDGTPAVETVQFGMDGTLYQVDLSAANAARLRDALAAFIGAARRRRRAPAFVARGGHPGGNRTGNDRDENRAIREWAAGHGLPVSRLGRLKQEIVNQYRAAHGH
jgi:hypothetical protein